MMQTITSDILNTLSEAERQAALSILQEYAATGSSELLDSFTYGDFKERPVDIETFLTDNRYLGKAWKDAAGNIKLYPFWLEQLKKLFPSATETAYNTLLESGARGLGKAQPLDTPVFTQEGFKPMKDIVPGTLVYGCDGLLHKVIAVFPQGKKPVYELEFSDHSKTKCSDEHLWTVRCNLTHKRDYKTLTLNQLLEQPLKVKAKNGALNSRYSIPLCNPLQFSTKPVFIDSYLMGCLLGDGHITDSYIKLAGIDQELFDTCESLVQNKGYTFSKYTDGSYGLKRIQHKNIKNEYVEECIKLKVNTTAYYKFIPDVYLYNDIPNRVALLQGLMDTDGNISKQGLCSFTTVSKQLAFNFKFLVESLGATAILQIRTNKKYKNSNNEIKECADSYTIRFKLSKDIIPVRLTRKKLNLSEKRKAPVRTIDKIVYLGEEECQCILVDSEEHLYLTDDLIVTHNSEIACGAVGAYLLYRVMCLKNPLEYYKLKPTEKIVFAFMNIKLELAKAIAVDKFQKTLQMSPWFMSKGRMTQKDNSPYWVPPEPISLVIGSQADDVIGQPVYFAFFDEISFIRNQDIDKQKEKAKNMIDTAIGGMMTRFVHGGKNPTMLVVASSKRSEQSFMEEYIKTLSATEGHTTLVIDKPVWEVKPKGTYSEKKFYVALGNKFLESIVIPDDEINELDKYKEKGYQILEVPIDFKAKFIEDIERNLCDFAGISSSTLNKYMSAQAVKEIINPAFRNAFTKDVLEIGNGPDDHLQYANFFDLSVIPDELLTKPLFIHLDMSLSGDMTGIAGSWIIGKKPSTNPDEEAKDLMFRLAFSVSIKAPKGRQISFEKNRNFIRWLKSVGFNIKGITYDTYQSADLGQQLSSEGFKCEVLSVDRVGSDRICHPYQYLKNVVYEKRLIMYKSERLFNEFVDVERNINTGKIDHTPNYHKDALDAVCGSIFTASKFASEFAFNYGESLEAFSDVNTELLADNYKKQQLIQDFEMELSKINLELKETAEIRNKQEIEIWEDYNDIANGIIVID